MPAIKNGSHWLPFCFPNRQSGRFTLGGKLCFPTLGETVGPEGDDAVTCDVAGGAEAVLRQVEGDHQGDGGFPETQHGGEQTQGRHDAATRCARGEKAFTAYLGDDRDAWDRHDAAKLIAAGAAKGVFDDILIDQGDADSFLTDQLKPELLKAAADAAGQKITLRMQPGYDHSYFFMASFIADHIAFHAARLGGAVA